MLRNLLRAFRCQEPARLPDGAQAPAIELPDTEGRPVAVSKLLEKGPVLAAFYKVSCPVCQYTMPFVERIYKAYGGGKAIILGISQDDARDTKEFAGEYGLTFPSLIDAGDYPVSNAYGLTNVPTFFLIQQDGTIAASFTGFDKAGLECIAAGFAEHLSAPPAAVFNSGEKVPNHKPG
ncbi:MAG TPA: TlpA disulfide reductase family protein [Candidatus Acidoferrales bacterium]|nr:TlpA disulfide reductase family protein [Candidatus Acidoferrales bacterium]